MLNHWSNRLAWGACTWLLAAPGFVLAAADHPAKGEAKPNILAPQFDLAIWTIVIFVLLLTVLRKFAWKPILHGLHQREANILQAVSEAKLARADTERIRAESQAKMDEAFAKIPGIMDEVRRDGEAMIKEMRDKALADINADRERMSRDMERARDQASKELWDQAAQLATLISVKAVGQSLNADDHRRLVSEALSEIQAPGK